MTTESHKRLRPSANAVIAFCALLIALGGSAIAAGGSSQEVKADKRIAKKVLKKLAPTLAVKKANKANLAATATNANEATSAQNAAALGGQPANSFAPSAKVIRYGVHLAYGGQQDIATVGPFTLTAKCIQDGTAFGTPHQDIAEILISTTQNGSVFDADSSKRGGPAPTDFLNTDTPEEQRIWSILGIGTETPRYRADQNSDGAAQAPDGTTIGQIQDLSGVAVNLPGFPGCLFHGTLMADS